MLSSSHLSIDWLIPDISAEQWEFSHHPDKQEFYQQHGVDWEQILSCFASGQLIPYPRSACICQIPVARSFSSYDDYSHYLAKAKRGYRKNYSRMEEDLQRHGTLTLPAPIILHCGKEALLFSGYRRLCLAWNYGMTPHVWLVPLEKTEVSCA